MKAGEIKGGFRRARRLGGERLTVYGTCQLNEDRINGVRGVVVPEDSKVHIVGMTAGWERD